MGDECLAFEKISDGYCAWSPKSGFEVEHTFCDTPEECEMRARWELGIIGEIGVDWLIKPVKIVPLEEWERLRKLELWALEASAA